MFVFGSDSYRREACVQELIDGYQKKRDAAGHSVHAFRPGEKSIEEITALARNTGLFAQKQCIVVRDAINTMKKGATLDPLRELIESTRASDNTVLIVVESVDVWSAPVQTLVTSLIETARCFDCTPLTEKTFPAWIHQHLTKHYPTATLSADASRALGVMASFDTITASNLIAQCVALAGGIISRETLEEFAMQTNLVSPFQVLDAWVQGNHALFSRQLSQADIDDGWKFGYTSALLTTLACALLLREQYIQQDVATIMNVKEFQVKKSSPLAKRLSADAIMNIYHQTLETDYGMKSGDTHAWDRLILTLTQI